LILQILIKYRFIFIALLLLTGSTVHAQAASDSLYGYSQVVTPGIRAARDIDEKGNMVKKPTEPVYRYFIYLATTSGTRVYPVELWIKGKAFSARSEAVTKTPVMHTNRVMPQHPQKQILVPKTTQNVVALVPIPLVAQKSSAKAKDLAQVNELVVVYKQGGKRHYRVLKELTELGAAAMQ
jgi:hypothetical protein